jgi:hypothetical protein
MNAGMLGLSIIAMSGSEFVVAWPSSFEVRSAPGMIVRLILTFGWVFSYSLNSQAIPAPCG